MKNQPSDSSRPSNRPATSKRSARRAATQPSKDNSGAPRQSAPARPGAIPPAMAAIGAQARAAASEGRPALWRPLPDTGFAPLLWDEGQTRVRRGAAALVAQGLTAGGRVLKRIVLRGVRVETRFFDIENASLNSKTRL